MTLKRKEVGVEAQVIDSDSDLENNVEDTKRLKHESDVSTSTSTSTSTGTDSKKHFTKQSGSSEGRSGQENIVYNEVGNDQMANCKDSVFVIDLEKDEEVAYEGYLTEDTPSIEDEDCITTTNESAIENAITTDENKLANQNISGGLESLEVEGVENIENEDSLKKEQSVVKSVDKDDNTSKPQGFITSIDKLGRENLEIWVSEHEPEPNEYKDEKNRAENGIFDIKYKSEEESEYAVKAITQSFEAKDVFEASHNKKTKVYLDAEAKKNREKLQRFKNRIKKNGLLTFRLAKYAAKSHAAKQALEMNKVVPWLIYKALYEWYLAHKGDYKYEEGFFADKCGEFLSLIDRKSVKDSGLTCASFNYHFMKWFNITLNATYSKIKQNLNELDRLRKQQPSEVKGVKTGSKNAPMAKPVIRIWNKTSDAELSMLLSRYGSKNIFVVTTTGTYYRLLPDEKLAETMIPIQKTSDSNQDDQKKSAYAGVEGEKLSTILCSNVDGSEKLPLWIVGSTVNQKESLRSLDRISSTISRAGGFEVMNSGPSKFEIQCNSAYHSQNKVKNGNGSNINGTSSFTRSRGLGNPPMPLKPGNSMERSQSEETKNTGLGCEENDYEGDDDGDDFPFYLLFNSKSVVTPSMFANWLSWFDARLKINKNRKILLLLTDSAIHRQDVANEMTFTNIRLLHCQNRSFGNLVLDLALDFRLNYRLRYYDYLLARFGVKLYKSDSFYYPFELSNKMFFCKDGKMNVDFTSSKIRLPPDIISIVDAAYYLNEAWGQGVESDFICSRFSIFTSSLSPRAKTHLYKYNNDKTLIELESLIFVLMMVLNPISSNGSCESSSLASFYSLHNIYLYACNNANNLNDGFPSVSYPSDLTLCNELDIPYSDLLETEVTKYEAEKPKTTNVATVTNPTDEAKNQVVTGDNDGGSRYTSFSPTPLDLGRLLNYPTESHADISQFSDTDLLDMVLADVIFYL
ncbi:hypothetical protein AX774_g3552 [Zancudomyces culisetae]|uniref:DDE-1 domain-containing protein n=1 Tax=Zancudomyces culisetae TaxID=1213189 RepID=A0A1R1PPS7_ZANCU|nr:hypothetical protein AX774_g3552 [Zancudomyces culisetae]|eukprot:OMH82958.1 hypothetical protein AX774_g3552 [Zancudomyces culisetae]